MNPNLQTLFFNVSVTLTKVYFSAYVCCTSPGSSPNHFHILLAHAANRRQKDLKSTVIVI
jgi:hypothetical protein